MRYATRIGIVLLAVTLAGYGIAVAAPFSRSERTLLPELDSRYYLGTTTPATNAWAAVVADQVCLTADSCRTTWPSSAAYPFPLSGNATSSPLMILASTTIGNGTQVGGLTISGGATTTLALVVQGTATSTFAGSLSLGLGNHIVAHGAQGDGSDGFHIDSSASGPQVALFGAGGTQGATFYGGVNIDGATRFATSLNGFGYLTGGALTASTSPMVGYITATSTMATSTFAGNLRIISNLKLDALTSALLLTGTEGDVAEYAGTSCTNQFVRSLSALGAATCATVANTDLANSTISGIALGSNLADLTATNATLTFSGTYNGSTARTIGLNVANANDWTALQTFANASSTQFSAGANLFYINSAGRIQAKDTTLGLTGALSPVKQLHLGVSTSTVWQGTSTAPYKASVSTTFAGTINSSSCYTNAGRLMGDIAVDTTHLATTFASSTAARRAYSANNTFTEGQIISLVAGTTTADSIPKSYDCDLQVTETF